MRLALLAALAFTTPAAADDMVVAYPFDGSFEDATFAVETVIVGQGQVIDYVSHVGAMLNRTGPDVGSDTRLFEAADVFLFCSAVVSRAVMEEDPMNFAHCPYGVFVVDREGQVSIGYRTNPAGAMNQVDDLLDAIAREAAG